MKHNILTIGILSAFFGTACTEKIDIELNEGENNRLVVEGYFSSDTMQHSVRLTRSTSYFYNQPAPAELGAIVTISDGEGNLYVLTDDDNDGVYLTDSSVFGVPGRTYTLNIKLKNGDEYEAKDEMLPTKHLDTARYEYVDEVYGVKMEEHFYEIYTTFEERPGVPDSYLLLYYFNDSCYNATFTNEILYARDGASVDGGGIFDDVLTIMIEEDSIPKNPTVRLDLYTISEPYCDFLIELGSETINNNSIMQGPPANMSTNIINKSGGVNGLGYFSARSRSTFTFKIDNRED